MSHTDTDVILRYTTNGNDPDENNSKLYSGNGFIISGGNNQTTSLKVRAFKEDCENSDVVERAYNFKLPNLIQKEILDKDNNIAGIYLIQRLAGATIRYTTDTTLPTKVYGNLNTNQPIVVKPGTRIRAKSYKEGWGDSDLYDNKF